VSAEPRAQGLAFGLFERYLEPLRIQAGIPGLAAAIVQNGEIVWEGGFGFADLERSVRVQPDTPFYIANLSQIFGATLLMQQVDRGEPLLDEPIGRWTNLVPQSGATIRQVLTHTTTGEFAYDPARFAALTPVIEAHTGEPYRSTLVREIFDLAAMSRSVPGHDLRTAPPAVRELFEPADLARYDGVLAEMAAPYRAEGRARPVRAEIPPQGLDASNGVVTTVRDLRNFDAALDEGLLLSRGLLAYMRGGAQPGTRVGLGWFVQAYNGQHLVWNFGSVPGAYSALMLKVPARGLTLILLANSDGLAEPFALTRGDVTTSLFTRLFLSLFVS
jgi:CubicO group peptidase (beta-lactamase class C family)